MFRNRFLLFVLSLLSCISLAQNESSIIYDIGELKDFNLVQKNAKQFLNNSQQEVHSKISPSLHEVYVSFEIHKKKKSKQFFQTHNPSIHQKDGKILVEFIAEKLNSSLLSELESMGLDQGASFGRLVSGWLPIESLGKLQQVAPLRHARESGLSNTPDR